MFYLSPVPFPLFFVRMSDLLFTSLMKLEQLSLPSQSTSSFVQKLGFLQIMILTLHLLMAMCASEMTVQVVLVVALRFGFGAVFCLLFCPVKTRLTLSAY